jgi:hypothetical protein
MDKEPKDLLDKKFIQVDEKVDKKMNDRPPGFMANQVSSNGGMQKMIQSMQKEIDKRFLKGIAASPGIVKRDTKRA